MGRRCVRVQKQPRPPPGELTEAAFDIAPRLEIAMRCGSSCPASQERGGRWRSEQATAFSARGLIPSLTLPFSRGGEIFRTSYLSILFLVNGCRLALTRSFGFENL